MAVSLVGQQPLSPSGFPSEYDAAQNALTKQRRLAELLQQQVFTPDAPLTTPGARMSWLAPVAKAMAGGLSGYMGEKADTAEKENAAARQAALTDMLNNPPPGTAAVPAVPGTPDIPAQPAANAMFGPTSDQGVSPLATSLATPSGGPPEASGGIAVAQKLLAANAPPRPTAFGSPASAANIMQGTAPDVPKSLQDASGTPFMLPQRGATDLIPGLPGTPAVPAKSATPQDWLAYGAKMSTLGPTAAKIGEQITSGAAAQLAPKSAKDRYMLAGNGDILDLQAEGGPKFLPGSPMAAIKQADLAQNRIATLEARADAAKQRSEDTRYSVDQRAEAAAQHNALMRELAAGRQAAGGQTFGTPEGASEKGNVILRDKHGIAHEVINGVPSKDPYTGAITPKVEQAKAVATGAKTAQGVEDMQAALDAVNADSKIFGKRANLGALAPNIFGIGPTVSGLSKEQLTTKANIQSMTADTTHSLYGSAFSAGEQKRAKGFLVDPTDSTELVQSKLAGRIKLEQDHYDNLPASARAAIDARRGGTPAPTTPTTPPAGKPTTGGAQWGNFKAQ